MTEPGERALSTFSSEVGPGRFGLWGNPCGQNMGPLPSGCRQLSTNN